MPNIQKIRKIIKAQGGISVPSYTSSLFTDNQQLNLEGVDNYLSNQLDLNNVKPLKAIPKESRFKTFSNNHQNFFNTWGKAADTLDSFIPKQNNSALTNSYNFGYDALADSSLMFGGPVGTVVGGAMKLGKFTSDSLHTLGAGTDQMTGVDKFFDSTPGTLITLGLNGFLGKKSRDFSANQNTISQVGGSYGGTVNNINRAVDLAGKKYGAFSSKARHNANKFINQADAQQQTMTDIAKDSEDLILRGQNPTQQLNYQYQISGGFDPQFSLRAKNGAKLKNYIDLETKEIEWEPVISLPKQENIVDTFKSGGNIHEEWEPIIVFKKGGEITKSQQKNVIPEGNLHARLHHMDDIKGITKKGIPVIDNNGEQQAEIELNEIIFTLEVTKKLEDLYNKFSNSETSSKEKNDLATEAGKLLVEEILFNTEDRTGLINTLKQGGKLNESEHSANLV